MSRRRIVGRSFLVGAVALAVFAMMNPACGSDEPARAPTTSPTSTTSTTSTTVVTTVSTTSRALVTIKVLYDNTAVCAGTQADWGFSCLVEGFEKTVLFDTGEDGDILLSNTQTLQIVPEDIDVVVLSHEHGDHTGGLARILARNPGITVYYPASFSKGFVRSAQAAGASLAPIEGSVSVCAGLLLTSPAGSPAESALLADTAEGWVLVAGCAHPGIVEMTTAASDLVGEPVFAVMGGFHLMSHSAEQVDQIVKELTELGVERCGPAHCTGEAATAQMKAAFADGFIEMGVGAVVTF